MGSPLSSTAPQKSPRDEADAIAAAAANLNLNEPKPAPTRAPRPALRKPERPGFIERNPIPFWVATVVFGISGLLLALGAINPLARWEKAPAGALRAP